MKKIILSIGFLIAMASFSGVEAANINVNVNIGVQPAWGPVGYSYAAFYYFPDINVYYNVNQGLFHYPQRGGWVSARYLPIVYRNYDLYGLYKVVLTDTNPWYFNQRHINDYRRFRGNRNQIVIRNSYDDRYRDSRRNDVRWYEDNNRGKNSNGRNWDSNYGRDNDRNNSRDNNRSTADRQRDSNRDGRDNNNNNREYNKSENKRTERSSSRNETKYADVSHSENSSRSSERKSEDRSKDRSSARSDSGRSSSSGRR